MDAAQGCAQEVSAPPCKLHMFIEVSISSHPSHTKEQRISKTCKNYIKYFVPLAVQLLKQNSSSPLPLLSSPSHLPFLSPLPSTLSPPCFYISLLIKTTGIKLLKVRYHSFTSFFSICSPLLPSFPLLPSPPPPPPLLLPLFSSPPLPSPLLPSSLPSNLILFSSMGAEVQPRSEV